MYSTTGAGVNPNRRCGVINGMCRELHLRNAHHTGLDKTNISSTRQNSAVQAKKETARCCLRTNAHSGPRTTKNVTTTNSPSNDEEQMHDAASNHLRRGRHQKAIMISPTKACP